MQNKKWNRLKISFVAVLAVTWIPAQLCSAFPVYADAIDVISIRPTRNSTRNMRFFIVLRLLYLCFFAALSGDFMIPHGSLRF